MAELYTKAALHAIKLGTDRVPDSFWHRLPGMRLPKEEKEKDKNKDKSKDRHRHRHRSEGAESRHRKDSDRRERDERDERDRRRRRRAASYSPYASEDDDSSSNRESRRSKRGRERHRDGRRHRDDQDWSHERPYHPYGVNTPPYSPSNAGVVPAAVPAYHPAAYTNVPHGQWVPAQAAVAPGYYSPASSSSPVANVPFAAPPVATVLQGTPPVVAAASPTQAASFVPPPPPQSVTSSRSGSIQTGVPNSRTGSIQAGFAGSGYSSPLAGNAYSNASSGSLPYGRAPPQSYRPASNDYGNMSPSRAARRYTPAGSAMSPDHIYSPH